ncbi:hypothetical protein Pmani_020831 [Petrolisthes manimaculis]|uniref:Ribonuclease P protein subunit p29 n=1 Tax=Petrolisthes manimaculis TaxID=1843537 RepID=A0AAE1PHW6_9EUCA|nr:hypothetical protein Pmani_020831 [Petrolisthes manimaculis]
MEVKTSEIYNELPDIVKERSGDIIGLPPPPPGDGNTDADPPGDGNTDSDPKHQLRNFLEKLVPSSDRDEVTDQVRKGFLLRDKRARVRPHKSLGKPKPLQVTRQHQQAPNRGRKRLTGRERRALGLNTIDHDNKSFATFVPINAMWRRYAQTLLGLAHFRRGGWTAGDRDTRTDTVQNRVRKMDYFGCLLRVSGSRCSEYVGITGIVLKETKNTMVIVCPDDRVKTIPKLHSEFSFVVDGVGFTILGNHLHQRPADRAKHNFKKHSLYL